MDKKVIVESIEDQRSQHLQTIQKLVPLDNVRSKVKMRSKEIPSTFTNSTPSNDAGSSSTINQQSSYTHVHPYRLVSQRPLILKNGNFSPSRIAPSQITYGKTYYQNMYPNQPYTDPNAPKNTHGTAKGIYKNYETISKRDNFKQTSPNRFKMTNSEQTSRTARDSQKHRSIKIYRKNLTALDEDSKKKVTPPSSVSNFLEQDILDKEVEVLESLDDRSLSIIVKKTMDLCNKMYGDALAEELRNHLGVEAYTEIANQGTFTTYAEFLAKRHCELNKENCPDTAQSRSPDFKQEAFDDEEQKLFELTATKVQKSPVFIKVDPKMLKSSSVTTNGVQSRELEKIQEKSGQKFVLKGNFKFPSTIKKYRLEPVTSECEENSFSLGYEKPIEYSPPNSTNLLLNISSEMSEFALKNDAKTIAEEVLIEEDKRAADIIISEKIAHFHSCATLDDSLEEHFTFNESKVNPAPPEKIFDSPEDPITTPKSLFRQEITPRNILLADNVEKEQEAAVVVEGEAVDERKMPCEEASDSNQLVKQTLSQKNVTPLIHTATSTESIVLSNSLPKIQSDNLKVKKKVTFLVSSDDEIRNVSSGCRSSKSTIATKSVEDAISLSNNLPEEVKSKEIISEDSNDLDKTNMSPENVNIPMHPAATTESIISSNSVLKNESADSKAGKIVSTVLLSSDGEIQNVSSGFRSSKSAIATKSVEDAISLSNNLPEEEKSKETISRDSNDLDKKNMSPKNVNIPMHPAATTESSNSVLKNESADSKAGKIVTTVLLSSDDEIQNVSSGFRSSKSAIATKSVEDAISLSNNLPEEEKSKETISRDSNDLDKKNMSPKNVNIPMHPAATTESSNSVLKNESADSKAGKIVTTVLLSSDGEIQNVSSGFRSNKINVSRRTKEEEVSVSQKIFKDEETPKRDVGILKKEKPLENNSSNPKAKTLRKMAQELQMLMLSADSQPETKNEAIEVSKSADSGQLKIEQNGTKENSEHEDSTFKTDQNTTKTNKNKIRQIIPEIGKNFDKKSQENMPPKENSQDLQESSPIENIIQFENLQKRGITIIKRLDRKISPGSNSSQYVSKISKCDTLTVEQTKGQQESNVSSCTAQNHKPTISHTNQVVNEDILNNAKTSNIHKTIDDEKLLDKEIFQINSEIPKQIKVESEKRKSESPDLETSMNDLAQLLISLQETLPTPSRSSSSSGISNESFEMFAQNTVKSLKIENENCNLVKTEENDVESVNDITDKQTIVHKSIIEESGEKKLNVEHSFSEVETSVNDVAQLLVNFQKSSSNIVMTNNCEVNGKEVGPKIGDIIKKNHSTVEGTETPNMKFKSENQNKSLSIDTIQNTSRSLRSPTTQVSVIDNSTKSPRHKDTNSRLHTSAELPTVQYTKTPKRKFKSDNENKSLTKAAIQNTSESLKPPTTKVSLTDNSTKSPQHKDTNLTSHTTDKLPKVVDTKAPTKEKINKKTKSKSSKNQSSPLVPLRITAVPPINIKQEPKDPLENAEDDKCIFIKQEPRDSDVNAEDEGCIYVDLNRSIFETPSSRNSGRHEDGFCYRRAKKLKQHQQRFFLRKKVKTLSKTIHRRIRTVQRIYKHLRMSVNIINSDKDCPTLDTKTLHGKIKKLNTVSRLVTKTLMTFKNKDIRSLKGSFQKIRLAESRKEVFSNVRIGGRTKKLNRSVQARGVATRAEGNQDLNEHNIFGGRDDDCIPHYEEQVVIKPLKTYSKVRKSIFGIKCEPPFENITTLDDVRKSSIDRNCESGGDGMKYASTPESIVHCIIYKDPVPDVKRIKTEIKLELDTENQTSIEVPLSPEFVTIKQEPIDYTEINQETRHRRSHRKRKISDSKTPDKDAGPAVKKVRNLRSQAADPQTAVESTPPKKKRGSSKTPDIQRVYPLRSRRKGNSA